MGLEKYGYFSEDGREFIITRPDTPAPWVNYISNKRYTGLVTNSGGGYSFFVCPKDSRITRHRYNCLPWDRPGRYIYLRADDGEYWSLTWQPTPDRKLDFYECRHGLGYTSIEQEYRGIRSKVTYFIPQEDDLEIWRVNVTNGTDRTYRLQAFSYVELCLGHALVDLINQPNDQHFNVVCFDREREILLTTKNYWVTYRGATVKQPNQAWDKWVYFASSLPVKGFDGKKDAFIGAWRSESNPIAVEEGCCRNTEITAGDACAALQSEITLEPGETIEFALLLGIVDREQTPSAQRPVPLRKGDISGSKGDICASKGDSSGSKGDSSVSAPPYEGGAGQQAAGGFPDTTTLTDKYHDMANVDAALDAVKKYWDDYLSAVTVETPDENMNLMLNVWAKRQAWVTFHMHRTAGYYHGGLLFGTGIRDQSQDLMGPVISEPEEIADRICEVLSHQFADGSTLHNFFRLTGQGEKTGHSDTPLWLPLAIMSYLKETGDFGFLDRVVPYHDEGEGDVLEHLTRAIDYPLSQLTERHLPKFGPGDWNDTLDYVGREGRGESIWVAEFLCYILREAADLLDRIGAARAARYRAEYDQIADALNAIAWDGEWYIRGTRDDGGVIGSHTNEEGRIFLESTTWAVISGIAPEDRARMTMDSVHKHLNTPRGPQLVWPAYRTVDPGVGLATRCVPGKKENGGIFNHPVAWAIMAECLLGNGDRAYEYYRATNPINQAYDPDIYRMEPYVYSEYVTSPEHPTFGEASHSWLTGSGVWMYRDGIDYILGVRPTYDGLIVDPCIPHEWDGFRITRKFRGATYHVEVVNPDHVEHGVASIEVDGEQYDPHPNPLPRREREHQTPSPFEGEGWGEGHTCCRPIEGTLLPLFTEGEHTVRVRLG